MGKTLSIAVFNGDGIGNEIMNPTVQILDALQSASGVYSLSFESLPAGAALYARTRDALPTESLNYARSADAILLSAIGLPDVRYDDGTEVSPHLDIRNELALFAGVRPVKIVPCKTAPLRLTDTVEFVLIRESTEGLFFSRGNGSVSNEEATETLKITRNTSEKLFRFAFALAKQRKSNRLGQGKVTCVDKANVFRAFAYFRDIFNREALNHPDIKHDHAYVDATALWMVQKPEMFDVLVTENMFGDILSDLAAGLMGGLGLAPSADIGEEHAMFQPCHGSAPDLANTNKANPFAMMLSAAMMLDWLGHKHTIPAMVEDAQRLNDAVYDCVPHSQKTTVDIGGTATTTEAADAVASALFA